MATDLENMKTARSAYLTELATGNVKPSYSIDGQSVDWNAYRASLLESIAKLNALIAADEIVEVETLGF